MPPPDILQESLQKIPAPGLLPKTTIGGARDWRENVGALWERRVDGYIFPGSRGFGGTSQWKVSKGMMLSENQCCKMLKGKTTYAEYSLSSNLKSKKFVKNHPCVPVCGFNCCPHNCGAKFKALQGQSSEKDVVPGLQGTKYNGEDTVAMYIRSVPKFFTPVDDDASIAAQVSPSCGIRMLSNLPPSDISTVSSIPSSPT